MKTNFDCIYLENNEEYAVVEKIQKEDYYFLYLFNTNNIKDFCIRKLIGNKVLGLSNDEEFDEALLMLREKNKELIEKIGL